VILINIDTSDLTPVNSIGITQTQYSLANGRLLFIIIIIIIIITIIKYQGNYQIVCGDNNTEILACVAPV
jgi:hypothetical protein